MIVAYDFILEFMADTFSIFKEYEYKLASDEEYDFNFDTRKVEIKKG
ncbi:UNVERIFIED_CONTAM: hypothetical protein O8I53_07480 [Campylobacter lari]